MNIEEERALFKVLCERDGEEYADSIASISLCQDIVECQGEVCVLFHLESFDKDYDSTEQESYYHLKKEDVDGILDGTIAKERLEWLQNDLDETATRLVDELYDAIFDKLEKEEDEEKEAKHEREDKWEDGLDNYPRHN